MALGPSILLPPLREIQQSIETIEHKYAGRMYLDVLSKEEEARVARLQGAPRSVVYNFLTQLSEHLYRFNILKSAISSEKRSKKSLITTSLTVGIIVVVIIAAIILRFTLYPRFRKADMIGIKVQYAYYGVLVLVFSAYSIFMMSTFYQKYSKQYDLTHDVENTFNTEPTIQYLIEMMSPVDKNIHVDFAKKQLRLEGTNPLVGFFLHQNRGLDVRYDFVPSSILSSERRDNCLKNRKSFNFSKKKTVPYTLTKDSLLSPSNLPCTLMETSSDKLYVDPFVGKTNTVGNPFVLKKKIDKFDVYGQYDSINNAILYFDTILSRDTMGISPFQKQVKRDITDYLKIALDLSNMIITNNLSPPQGFLERLPPERKRELISKEQFLVLCLNLPVSYAFYDSTQRIGYLMDENDLQNIVLVYLPRDLDVNSNNGSFGQNHYIKSQNLSVSLFKRYITPNGLSNPSINVAVPDLPASNILQEHFKAMKDGESTSSNTAFEADVDAQTGSLTKIYEDSLLVSKRSSLLEAPDYRDILHAVVSSRSSDKQGKTSPIMFIYQMKVQSYIAQSRGGFLSDTYESLKDILLQHIIHKIGDLDSTYSVEIDVKMEKDVMEYLEFHLGKDFRFISNDMIDAMNEIPIRMGLKRKAYLNEKGSDGEKEKKMALKYITFDMFLVMIKSMSQEDFLYKFVKNLDTIRLTSRGLKQLHDRYNHGFAIEQKNNSMFEVSFYVLLCVGFTEFVRLSIMRYIDFRCRKMYLQDKILEAKNRYEINYSLDDRQTRDNKTREFEKAKEKIIQNQVKASYSMFLYISVLFFIYIFAVSLVFAWKEKTRHLYNFNKFILETNGNKIVMDSDQLLHQIVTLITKDKQFFFTSSNYAETGDPDELFYLLEKNAHLEKEKSVVWTMPIEKDKDHVLKQTYLKLIDTIENYKKCNILVDSRTQQLPFPLVDTILYIMLLGMLIGLLIFTVFKLKPFEHYKNMVNWTHIKELLANNVDIEPSSFNFICHESDDERKSSYDAIRLIVAVIIVVLGILLSVVLFKNSLQMERNLYSSTMFSEMECYGLK